MVATIAVVMFGGMYRYDDASGLLWSNIRFESDGSGSEISFDKRKNAQFRQGEKKERKKEIPYKEGKMKDIGAHLRYIVLWDMVKKV